MALSKSWTALRVIHGQGNLVLADDVEEGHDLRHVHSLRIRHINTSDEEEE